MILIFWNMVCKLKADNKTNLLPHNFILIKITNFEDKASKSERIQVRLCFI